jgi:hypothetical protein
MLYERRVEPLSTQWRSYQRAGGAHDTARRSYTERVEGMICLPQHLILVTLKGGAEYQEVEASCGHRFVGSDHPGTVSFEFHVTDADLRLVVRTLILRPTKKRTIVLTTGERSGAHHSSP